MLNKIYAYISQFLEDNGTLKTLWSLAVVLLLAVYLAVFLKVAISAIASLF